MPAHIDIPNNIPIVCYAEDWGRLPSSTQHLMRGLSKTHPILWVDSMGLRTPSAASSGDLKRIWNKVKKFSEGIEEVEPNIWRLSPLVVPLAKWRWVRAFNRRLMKVYVGGWLKKNRYDRFIQWSSSPTSAPMLGVLGETANVYYVGDEFSEFSQFNAVLVQTLERPLLVRSDIVFVVSERLRETKSQFSGAVNMLPHGCDYDHFSSVSRLSESDIPADLAGISRPRIGYYGLIRDWFDFAMLREILTHRKDWSLVLVGPRDTDVSAIANLPNVHLLGPKQYAELPKYLRGFDVGIIPYRDSEITRNANPLKLLEYLASGIPVVSTDLPAVRPFCNCLALAADKESFETGIARALEEKSLEAAQRRQKLAAENSWSARVEQVECSFGKHIYPLVSPKAKPVVMHLIAAMNIGGAERIVQNLAGRSIQADSEYDHRVTSFVRISDGYGVEFLRGLSDQGVLCDRLPIYKGWDLKDIGRLRRIIRKHRVDLLHTHGYKADIVGQIAARREGIPIVATAHGFSAGRDKLNRNEKIGRWFLRRVDRVIAVSENVKNTLLESGIDERKLILLPNAINFAEFAFPPSAKLRDQWGVAADQIVVGTAGRLSPEKAQGNLIRAVAQLPQELKNKIVIVIAGEGPERECLLSLAEELKMAERVKLVGFVRDVSSLYHSFDLFCLPSLTEGHPLTLMEASASGVPAIASRVGAIGQLVNDGVDGFTVPPGDVALLSQAIAKALALPDRGKAMGRVLGVKLSKSNDIGPWAARIEDIYGDLIGRQK